MLKKIDIYYANYYYDIFTVSHSLTLNKNIFSNFNIFFIAATEAAVGAGLCYRYDPGVTTATSGDAMQELWRGARNSTTF